jgi:zinc transport system permease protein
MSDFFQTSFIVRGLLAGLSIAAVAPVLGMFLTVKRQSLIADTLSHASLAGVAIGAALGFNPLLGAAVCAIIAAMIIERLRRGGRFSGDATLAVVLSGSLALAVVLLSANGGLNAGVLGYLFGGITTVSQADLYVIAVIALVVLLFLAGTFPMLFLIAFDEEVARSQGVKVDVYNMLLAIATAAVVAAGMRVVGVLLMGALMVIPVLSAVQLNQGFKKTTMIAIAISLLSVFLGLYASYALDVAAGGTIVLVAIGFFLVSLVIRALRE